MKNKKGFTLVEIIVGIMIASIVLGVAGSMIISSFKTVNNTSEIYQDKQIVDELMDVIYDEVEYAKDVRLIPYSPNNELIYTLENDWHSIYVKDGKVMLDNQNIISDSYYRNRNIQLYAKGTILEEVNIDLKTELYNRKDENTYSIQNTLIFLNVDEKRQEVQDGVYKERNLVSLNSSDLNYYVLYYRKSMPFVELPEGPKKNGTVEDIVHTIDLTNNLWYYERDVSYSVGDIVYHKDTNSWWRCEKTTNDPPNSATLNWKKLDRYYSPNSNYAKGDVIIDNAESNKYFRKIGDRLTCALNENGCWEEISQEIAEQTTYEKIENNLYNDSILKKLKDIDLDKIPLYDENKKDQYSSYKDPMQPNHFVKIKDPLIPGEYYHYYYKVFNYGYNSGPEDIFTDLGNNTIRSEWQEIRAMFKDTSAYAVGDIVYAMASNTTGFKSKYICTKDILTQMTFEYIENNGGGSNFKFYTDPTNSNFVSSNDQINCWQKQ